MSGRTMRGLPARSGRTAIALALGLLLAGAAALSAAAEPAWSRNPARSNEGEVQFTLTPRDASGGRFRVDIVVTTHSGDLRELDLQSAMTLNLGPQTLRPLIAPALRGHHVKGRLEFALERVPEAFEIVIRGVRSMGDLTFRWP